MTYEVTAHCYVIGQPPYGYRHDDVDPRRWVVDNEAADIVRRIYAMRQDGISINEIAKNLKCDKILIPSLYAQRKGYKNPTKRAVRGEFLWDKSNIRQILTNRAYIGDIINFRTYSKSYKLKERLDNPAENWGIHENACEAIINIFVWYHHQYCCPASFKYYPVCSFF